MMISFVFIHFSYYGSLLWNQLILRVVATISTCRCLFLSTVLSMFTLFFGLMFRLVMSGPGFLSLSILSALILGSVCSIWAKFSNGDNYRGRPGERRRWVLPVYRVSCMLLQASQLHLPAFPLSAFISVTVCHHRSSGLAINSDSPSDCSFFLFFPHPA